MAISVVDSRVTPAVFKTRKVIMEREAVSLSGLCRCMPFIACRPTGVAAEPSPTMLTTTLVAT